MTLLDFPLDPHNLFLLTNKSVASIVWDIDNRAPHEPFSFENVLMDEARLCAIDIAYILRTA
jgi:hypothetical protein